MLKGNETPIPYRGPDADPTDVVDAAMEEYGPENPALLLEIATHSPELSRYNRLRAIEILHARVGLHDVRAAKHDLLTKSQPFIPKRRAVLISTRHSYVPRPNDDYLPPRPYQD